MKEVQTEEIGEEIRQLRQLKLFSCRSGRIPTRKCLDMFSSKEEFLTKAHAG